MIDNAQTIDSSSKDATTSPVLITTETKFTMYIASKSGSSINHRIVLQFSPDGVQWFDSALSVTGVGFVTQEVCAAQIRAKVIDMENSPSTSEVCILGR